MRCTLVCGVAVLLLAAPAAAGTIGVALGVAPGKLVVRAQPTAVDGTASLTVRVADGRGSGQGWTLRLRTGAGLTVTAITATCAARSTCTLPTAIGTPSGTTVLRAASNTGMGSIDLRLTVHANARTTAAFTIS